ncbi:amidohydrolase [Maricurvus nonylphenolicus]|uniref:amidohydrolase n=1 Tax=Maricurvus nonylphenolicus TaxID=1008307 RepID=UPI0036F34486
MKLPAILSASLISSSLLLQGCSDTPVPVKQVAPSQVLYSNARIYTQDKEQPWADAMVVEDNTIVFVGNNTDAINYISTHPVAGTQSINLNGDVVLPGLIDTHTHPGLVATLAEDDEEASENHLPVDSKESLYKFLQDYADKHPFKPIVMLGEWDVNTFLPEGPNKAELDKIFPLRPVVLLDNSGHSQWANSSALKLLGVNKDTPDLSPNISMFARDEHGEPTGWIKEFAIFPKIGGMLVPGKEEVKEGVLAFLSFLSSRGVTTLWDAGNFNFDDDIYEAIAELDREGLLPVRYEGSYHIFDPKQIDIAAAEFLELRRKYAGHRLQFNTLKIHYDGVNEILTGGMLEPYAIDPDNRGGILFDAERLSRFMEELNQEGIHLHLHTVGDWATREALDAVELARGRNNNSLDIEITLSHLEIVSPEDIPRFAELDVHANFTPHWFGGTVFGEAGKRALGLERAKRSQVAKAFVDAGANVTLSSDVVSERESYRADPFIGMQMSVTRKEYNDPTGPVLSPANAGLTLEDALAAYTTNGAQQLGFGNELGSLSAGMKADFVVLPHSPFDMDINQLHQITPKATVLDGVLVSGTLIKPQHIAKK